MRMKKENEKYFRYFNISHKMEWIPISVDYKLNDSNQSGARNWLLWYIKSSGDLQIGWKHST